MPGTSLFDVAGSIGPDGAARQLVRFLGALHDPATRQRAEAAVGPLTGAELPPATTGTLRDRLGTWIRPEQHRTVLDWCDWADVALASPGPAVLVHGDLHGDNQVWDHDELRLVVGFATVGAAEPEYELRAFPGAGLGPGVELLTAVMRHYQQITGRQLSPGRIMAWHLRQALGDMLWRSEAGQDPALADLHPHREAGTSAYVWHLFDRTSRSPGRSAGEADFAAVRGRGRSPGARRSRTSAGRRAVVSGPKCCRPGIEV